MKLSGKLLSSVTGNLFCSLQNSTNKIISIASRSLMASACCAKWQVGVCESHKAGCSASTQDHSAILWYSFWNAWDQMQAPNINTMAAHQTSVTAAFV